ncbi:hypothetical protein BG842_04985 [Haladaptatus sp. W1]|uniref:C2 family cysteine protease n=1 Tax=Haladaptatus sp. W1 TaxID=1897478 RepID=UPI000849D2CA|nr:C2 family cysteine protease [Haladaptatus sp. W1]ODR79867.1 hypothetical protein BG842_04985 [Haladaptatus sp. W1]
MSDKKIIAEAEKIGVGNPYALAELIKDEKIEWSEIDDVEQFLEENLGTPYEELFDPKFDSPLYPNITVTEDGTIERRASETDDEEDELSPDVEVSTDRDDSVSGSIATLPSEVRTLIVGSGKKDKDDSVAMDGGVEVKGTADFAESSGVDDKHDGNMTDMDVDITDLTSGTTAPTLLESDAPEPTDLERPLDVGWEPAGIDWIDAGEIFKQGAEQFDPVQGAVGDCYFIAALSAVAWTKPSLLRHTVYADTSDHRSLFRFFDGNSSKYAVASERIPLREGSNNFIYARSAEHHQKDGEVWPAVYEKAYAIWKTGATDDKPEIPAIAGGDPVRACAELAGSGRKYYGTKTRSGDQLWDIVRGNSRGGKTFNPMVAWTYPSASAAPDRIDYGSAKIVANHAYTVLGWMYRSGTRYMVLRNPWGQHEATVGVIGGRYQYLEDGAWKSIDLSNSDGVFAIEADTFKRYFAGLGVNA